MAGNSPTIIPPSNLQPPQKPRKVGSTSGGPEKILRDEIQKNGEPKPGEVIIAGNVELKAEPVLTPADIIKKVQSNGLSNSSLPRSTQEPLNINVDKVDVSRLTANDPNLTKGFGYIGEGQSESGDGQPEGPQAINPLKDAIKHSFSASDYDADSADIDFDNANTADGATPQNEYSESFEARQKRRDELAAKKFDQKQEVAKAKLAEITQNGGGEGIAPGAGSIDPSQDPAASNQANSLSSTGYGGDNGSIVPPQENSQAKPGKIDQARQLAVKAKETAEKAQKAVKTVQTVAKSGRFIAVAVETSPIWIWGIVVIIILALIFGVLLGFFKFLNHTDESGGGADEYFYTGQSSPVSCTKSVVEAGFGVGFRQAGILNNNIDILPVNSSGVLTPAGVQGMNAYAKYAALTSQITANIIRTGKIYDTNLTNPTLAQPNSYNSGISVPESIGPILKPYLDKLIDATPPASSNVPNPEPKAYTNLSNYDADIATMKVEGVGLHLAPSTFSLFSYDFAPTSFGLSYFDTATTSKFKLGGELRDIVAGPISLPGESATVTRKAHLSESFGILGEDFNPPGTTTTAPILPPVIPPDYDPPENPDGTIKTGGGPRKPNDGYSAPPGTVLPIPSGIPSLTGSAVNRLTDTSLISYNSLSLGVAGTVTFVGGRIPFISDFIEWLIGNILKAIKIDLIQIPVFSNGFYASENLGSFSSTLLNNFEASSNTPFAKYTGHTVIQDGNLEVDIAKNQFITPAVDKFMPPNVSQVKTEIPNLDTYAGNTNPQNGNITDTINNAINSNPIFTQFTSSAAALKDPTNGKPSTAFIKQWQDTSGPTALRQAMASITSGLLKAGNTQRTVSGINVKVTINLAINILPGPPFVNFLLGLPTIDGIYAKKNVSNAPNGQEYLDLYNRVGIAVMKAAGDPAWPKDGAYNFGVGAFGDPVAVGEGMDKWLSNCKSGQYDTTEVGGGGEDQALNTIGSAFTGINGLNSCKLYTKKDGKVYDQYLPALTVSPTDNTRTSKYVTTQELDRLSALGIKDRKSYYESIIIAEAKTEGIDPSDGYEDDIDKAKLAYILATAGFETNAQKNYLDPARQIYDNDFNRFSEVNPMYLKPISDIISAFAEKAKTGDIPGAIADLLTTGVYDPIRKELELLVSASDGDTIVDFILNIIAGFQETYGPLGKGLLDTALGALKQVVDTATKGFLNRFGIDINIDLQSFLKKLYDINNSVNILGVKSYGLFDDDVIGHVFDANVYAVQYYGRGFLPNVIRGKGIYEQLQGITNKRLLQNPNDVRQNPSTMAQTLVMSMRYGIYSGFKLDDFFNIKNADIANARSIIDKNYIVNAASNTDLNLQTKIATQKAINDQIIVRYTYYYNKLSNPPKDYFKNVDTVCNAAPDGNIFKDIAGANAKVKEGFNYVNTSNTKNKYQSYGVTITANEETPIYPLFGGKILYSNFATTQAPSAKSVSPTPVVDDTARKQRRLVGDPLSGNQLSIVSNVDNQLYITRYTNLSGTKLPPIGVAPGTSINKDDILGYISNSGPKDASGNPPEFQLRIEILAYSGKGLVDKTTDILTDAKQNGYFVNPAYLLKTQITKPDDTSAIPLATPGDKKLYSSLSEFVRTPPKGINVPGFNGASLDPWLLLR